MFKALTNNLFVTYLMMYVNRNPIFFTFLATLDVGMYTMLGITIYKSLTHHIGV
jgi:hypothetical protein